MDDPERPRPGPAPDPEPRPAADPSPPPYVSPYPDPRTPAAPPPVRHTRRWVLAGGLAILACGGAGVGAAFLRHRTPHRPPAPPAALVATAEAERRLIADLVATTGGSGDVRVVIEQATADHRAHLAVFEALLGHYRAPAASPSRVPGTPRTKAQLRAAEQAAAAALADQALRMAGTEAALFASIAACEATHAELLT